MTRAQMIDALRSVAEDAGDIPRAKIEKVIAALDNEDRFCACTEFDDGSSFGLASFAGGGCKDGAFSFVNCTHTKPDGSIEIMRYRRESQPEGFKPENVITTKRDSGAGLLDLDKGNA